MHNQLTSVTIPASVTSAEEGPFLDNPLGTITFLGRENLNRISVVEAVCDSSPTLNYLS